MACKLPGFICWLLTTALWFAFSPSACAQKNPFASNNQPMKRPAPDPHGPRWHTLQIAPRAELPEIHCYDKLNPVWWFGNADEPTPPEWYRPESRHRETLWACRNPFHNFTFYVIGVADKTTQRSGYYPRRNSNPNGGWQFAVTRRRVIFLPFVSYDRNWCRFYLGWRERGNFGVKLNFGCHSKPRPASAPPARNAE